MANPFAVSGLDAMAPPLRCSLPHAWGTRCCCCYDRSPADDDAWPSRPARAHLDGFCGIDSIRLSLSIEDVNYSAEFNFQTRLDPRKIRGCKTVSREAGTQYSDCGHRESRKNGDIRRNITGFLLHGVVSHRLRVSCSALGLPSLRCDVRAGALGVFDRAGVPKSRSIRALAWVWVISVREPALKCCLLMGATCAGPVLG